MSWLARSYAARTGSDELVRQTRGQDLDRLDDHMIYNNERGGGRLSRQIMGASSAFLPSPTPYDSDDDYTPDSVLDWRLISDVYYRGGLSGLGYMLYTRFEDQIGGAVGITEESLAFASNIAHHPETWLDFPLFGEDDMDDFDMCDALRKHIMAVERLVPRLAALRFELCSTAHISKAYFWKVYFVLLHSRLTKHDAQLLSNPQIVAARALWLQELQKRVQPELDQLGRFTSKESTSLLAEDYHLSSFDVPKYTSVRTSSAFDQPAAYSSATKELETEKDLVVWALGRRSVDDSVIQKEQKIEDLIMPSPSNIVQQYDDDDDGDEWLEEHAALEGYSGPNLYFATHEDVSFSDLEDDDDEYDRYISN